MIRIIIADFCIEKSAPSLPRQGGAGEGWLGRIPAERLKTLSGFFAADFPANFVSAAIGGQAKFGLILILGLIMFFPGRASAEFTPPMQYYDVDNNRQIDDAENQVFEEDRLMVFDLNRNGALEEDELDTYAIINAKLVGGGEALNELSQGQKDLYREWREVLLSLKANNPGLQIQEGAVNQPNIEKCYPDNVCDLDEGAGYAGMPGQPGMPIGPAGMPGQPGMPAPGSPAGMPSGMPMGSGMPPGDTFMPPVGAGMPGPGSGQAATPTEAMAQGKELTIFYAAGLNSSMDMVIKKFKETHPRLKIIGESSGSLLAVRKLTDLNKPADLLFVADALAIRDMLTPVRTGWYITFYKDRMVLAHTEKSKYTNEINSENWYNILLRKGVRFGYANPALAPIGYRTLIAWKLADRYYKDKEDPEGIYEALKKACPPQQIMPDVAELLPLLESLSLDYAFIYESTAKQHNLKYVQLPGEIDLGSMELADIYKQAKVEVASDKAGKKIQTFTGAPIAFALTILDDAPNYDAAVEFVRVFLGPEGQGIMASNDQQMIIPCRAFNPELVPNALRGFISPDADR